MWPERGEALSRTIEAERAVEDLYAQAAARWLPKVAVFALPGLTAATLPPHPEAVVADGQADWDDESERSILLGMMLVWALSLLHAFRGITEDEGLEFDVPDADLPEIPEPVMRAVVRSVGVERSEVRQALKLVESNTALQQRRDDFVASQRPKVATFPTQVRDKLDMALKDADAFAPSENRLIVRDILVPSSEEIRELTQLAGYQAAGIQNNAAIAAAIEIDTEEKLDKVWISTIDGKTRPSHWAADGQRAPVDGSFTVGGVSLEYPGDPAGPLAEVKNCRCRVGVLAEDEELPEDVDRHTERLDGRDSTAANRSGSQADEIARREARGNVRARDDSRGVGRTAAGGWTAPSEEEYTMTKKPETFRTFTDATLGFVGVTTSDGRRLAEDIELSFRSFPQPLMWCKQNSGGHTESFTIGVFESAEVRDGVVYGSGYLLNTPEADEAANEMGHKVTRPSLDLGAAKWHATDESGTAITEDNYDPEVEVFVTVTKAEMIGATLVSKAAFGDTSITLNPERETREIALVASAAEKFRPRVYAHQLFEDPGLTGPTRLTMTEDGHIFGHVACFGECHRSIQADCILAPRSQTGYAHFHTSPSVRLDNGERLAVGRLTVATGHAPDTMAGGVAQAHYDNTGTCFAIGRVGEDEHGIWFSGVAAPWATAEQVEMGMSAPLSGDWRDFGSGNLELIAALAVNTPGFAVGRQDEDGRTVALVASLAPGVDAAGGMELSLDQITAAVREAVRDEISLSKKADADDAAFAEAKATVLARVKAADLPTPNEMARQLIASRNA